MLLERQQQEAKGARHVFETKGHGRGRTSGPLSFCVTHAQGAKKTQCVTSGKTTSRPGPGASFRAHRLGVVSQQAPASLSGLPRECARLHGKHGNRRQEEVETRHDAPWHACRVGVCMPATTTGLQLGVHVFRACCLVWACGRVRACACMRTYGHIGIGVLVWERRELQESAVECPIPRCTKQGLIVVWCGVGLACRLTRSMQHVGEHVT